MSQVKPTRDRHGICNNCGASKPVDHYRACAACRAEWRARGRKTGGRADRVEQLEATLRLALPIMRENLMMHIDAHAVHGTDRASKDLFAPLPGTVGPYGALVAEPMIKAIRAAEALVGRPFDGRPKWLDDVIDGRRRM